MPNSKVHCKDVHVERIRDAFYSNREIYLKEIVLELPENESMIPKDIFASHYSINIVLIGNKMTPELFYLQIDSEAFQSSSQATQIFIIESFNALNFDWSFLATFRKLKTLSISYAANMNLSNLPLLPKLIELNISYCIGLNDWTHFPLFFNGLELLVIQNCGLKDKEADQILNWIGPSKDTLVCINFGHNALTRIPRQLLFFSRLNEIGINHQTYPGLGSIANLSFLAPVNRLNLSSSHVKDIQPGAFNGLAIFPSKA